MITVQEYGPVVTTDFPQDSSSALLVPHPAGEPDQAPMDRSGQCADDYKRNEAENDHRAFLPFFLLTIRLLLA